SCGATWAWPPAGASASEAGEGSRWQADRARLAPMMRTGRAWRWITGGSWRVRRGARRLDRVRGLRKCDPAARGQEAAPRVDETARAQPRPGGVGVAFEVGAGAAEAEGVAPGV